MTSSEFFASRAHLMHALLEAFVPAAASLDGNELTSVLAASDDLIAGKPANMHRQLLMALIVIRLLAILRFGRGLARVDVERRRRFLASLQDSPALKLRLAVWGLRTLLFGGYYADPVRQNELGYHPHPDGWDARRGAGSS